MRVCRALVPFALIVIAVPVAADPEITAYGTPQDTRSISGPDEAGRYTLRVPIADLDVTSPAGWGVMNRRVAMGTSLLCDASGAAPAYAGYYSQEQRDCWQETRAVAAAQMVEARELARQGRGVAFLDVGRQAAR